LITGGYQLRTRNDRILKVYIYNELK
jgi:hypothetical protein